MIQPASEQVLVIGAGPAGIASAYALEQIGLSYRVVDRAEVIGSTWHGLYPSLRLNTTRFYSHMPGVTFPWSYGIFPSARQYHAYLSDFVQRHHFNIHLGVDVQRVTPAGDYWRVETSEGVCHYAAVISATGVFNNPIMPDIAGMASFNGTIMHAHDYTHPDQIRGKRVLVVGNGPSGIDISVDAAQVADKAWIAIRTGVTFKRRYPYGLPKHVWMMLGDYLPRGWCEKLLTFVDRLGFDEQERVGLRRPQAGGSAVAYRGPELVNVVKSGKVMPVVAPVAFDDERVILADDSQLEPDIVIMATGYEPVLHQYLDIEMQFSNEPYVAGSPCDWQIGPNGQRGWPLRDTSDHPNGRQILGHPGLYVVGTFYKGKGAMYNFNVEAQIAAEQIQAYLARHQAQAAACL